jgi:hypothetical protein
MKVCCVSKGKIKDRINKDLQLSFKDVDLFKITPANDQFVLTVMELLIFKQMTMFTSRQHRYKLTD